MDKASEERRQEMGAYRGMSESDREAEVDRRVQRILATDPGYRYAGSAEEQARVEAEVVEAVERAVDREAS